MAKKNKYNWDIIRKEFQESNLSYNAFARQKCIPQSTAHTHLKDLIALKKSTSNCNASDDEYKESFEFIPIEVLEAEAATLAPEVTFIQTSEESSQKAVTSGSPIEIKIKECSIVLNSGFDKTTLKDAMEVLISLC